ncbi:MAG: hypothetical protein ACFFCD_08665 [Promethearchaeota archaeon]
MPEKIVLYEEPGGIYRVEVELPLTSKVKPEEFTILRDELGIPSYVDLDYLPIKSALVMLTAAEKAHTLQEEFPDMIAKRIAKTPLNILIFGGGAFKLHCPSCNAGGAFERVLHDIDIVVPRKQGGEVRKLLLALGDLYGTMFLHFISTSDKIFTMQRRGKRHRVRSIKTVGNENDHPTVEVMDILTNEIDMRHTINVEDEFKQDPKKLLYTIGLEKMIATKCQFIMDMDKEVIPQLEASGLFYRQLHYEHYDEDKIIIGMEKKDIKDVSAAFLDHPLGEGPEAIDIEKMKKILSDKKLLKTVRLNLANILHNQDFLESTGASASQISTIITKIEDLLEQLPESDKKWSKPWWNLAVETPEIFEG